MISQGLHSNFKKIRKGGLYLIKDLAADCTTQHSEKIYKDNNNNMLSLTNYKATSYIIKIINERSRESLHEDSSKSFNKLDTHNIELRKLSSIITGSKHYRDI